MSEEFIFFEKTPEEVNDFISKEFFDDHLEKTNTQTQKYCICAKENREIIAVSKGGIFKNSLFISEFIVKKSKRNSGIGKKLIEKTEDYAKQAGCKNIWVDTYEYQAPEFYLKNNFVEKNRIKNYRGKDARIFFEKEI